MLKVAMIDHHLNNYHADTFLRLLRGPLATEELEIVTAWESDPVGADWCEKNKVRRAGSIKDALEGVDAVLLLAPDNIDVHMKLAAEVLPAGKPTLIDKFLSPNLADANAIVALAKKHATPILSSSSLRYAVELEAAIPKFGGAEPSEAFVQGQGNWGGYGVHSLSLALRIMGPRVQRVINTGTSTTATVTLDYGKGRRALVDVRAAENQGEMFNWKFLAKVGNKYIGESIHQYDGFYTNLMRRSATLFKTKMTDMPIEEMLVTVAVLEGAEKSVANGTWEAITL